MRKILQRYRSFGFEFRFLLNEASLFGPLIVQFLTKVVQFTLPGGLLFFLHINRFIEPFNFTLQILQIT